MATTTVLIALRRIGPYHHARLAAAHGSRDGQGELAVVALETRPHSLEYAWDYAAPAAYPIERLEGSLQPESDPPNTVLDGQIQSMLDQHRPQVIVTVGWADRSYRRLVLAAQHRRLPLVIVSDSRWSDEPRQAVKEAIKRIYLRCFSAALVAGQESRNYVERLGIPGDGVFQPWDVIDNAFFADRFSADQPSMAPRHPDPGDETDNAAALPDTPHFLCVSRFIAKKNLPMLLRAYGTYQQQGGGWGLRLIGGGPLEVELRRIVHSLPDPSRIELKPFVQLEEIRACYQAAQAFLLASSSDQWGLAVNEAMAAGVPVLVSTACGCCVDLVEHGVTGWSFDPHNGEALTELLHQAERQSSAERTAMVQVARERLAAFSPGAFANGLAQAARWALAHPRHSRSGAALAQLLSRASA